MLTTRMSSVSRIMLRRSSSVRRVSARRYLSEESSSATKTVSSSPSPESPQIRLANIALASSLLGFCGFVFTYSMNAVGKAESDNDPLAQLKLEAQEAKELHAKQNARRLNPDEIAALESGVSNRDGNVELAVAAPAEIAELEEEANRKVFQSGDDASQQQQQKKKPWWRFGF